MNQTWTELEVLVVDDGSQDRTGEIVRSMADPRVRYYQLDDLGVGAARNYGMWKSRGKYITFLDADDFYLPDKIRQQAEFLETHCEYQVAYCDALLYYSDRPKQLLTLRANYPSGDILPSLIRSSFINPNTLLIPRQVLDASVFFSEGQRGRYAEDWEFCLKMSKVGFRFAYLAAPLVVVEMRPDSAGKFNRQWLVKENAVRVLAELCSQMTDEERETYKSEASLKRLKFSLAVAYLVKKDRPAFERILHELVPQGLYLPIKTVVGLIPNSVLRNVLVDGWGMWRRQRRYCPARVPASVTRQYRALQRMSG